MAEETIGARLIRARLEYGSRLVPPRVVTQLEVGEALGVSGVAVGAWEAGRSEPGLDRLRRVAAFYGVRVSWLAFGDGPMRDDEGEQGAKPGDSPRPSPIDGPTVRRTLPKDVSRLDDLPKGNPTGTPKRRPKDRTALAS